MSNNQTKERTFFQYAGGNAYYGEDDIDWDRLNVDIFHIGYILLLPHLDEPDAEYGIASNTFLPATLLTYPVVSILASATSS